MLLEHYLVFFADYCDVHCNADYCDVHCIANYCDVHCNADYCDVHCNACCRCTSSLVLTAQFAFNGVANHPHLLWLRSALTPLLPGPAGGAVQPQISLPGCPGRHVQGRLQLRHQQPLPVHCPHVPCKRLGSCVCSSHGWSFPCVAR